MIIVNSGNTNDVTYYTRYIEINKYEILDHNSMIVSSGLTTIIGYNGKINHTGLTYNFTPNQTFSYKSYYVLSGVSYLANHSYIRSFSTNERLDKFIKRVKEKNSFLVRGKDKTIIYTIIDGGSASIVYTDFIDGGSASFVGTEIINGNY